MKKININTECTVYQDISELSEMDRQLIVAAKLSAEKAYAPYSNFKVGAAILMEDDTIITGNNQENAAYPSGLCAERTAVFYAASQFPNKRFKKIAITAISPSGGMKNPVPPCGSCRQSLLEYENKFGQPIEIMLIAEVGEVYVFESVNALLPFSFNSSYLSK